MAEIFETFPEWTSLWLGGCPPFTASQTNTVGDIVLSRPNQLHLYKISRITDET